ncbi:MAG: hypothetical protein EOO73_34380 [Myxococcales bacterium]|nr:MAG: hypothetical protein EOO73_34380 [Myxococcales bacterium]
MLTGRWLSRRSTLTAAALAASIASSSPPAHAQSSSDELARRHFESGVAYLEESDYEAAIVAFQKAYDLSKRPEILLNLATVQERKSDPGAALTALRAYLQAAPQGEHVTTVQLRIQNLEKRLREQGASPAAPAPSPPPPPPPARVESAPAPVLSPPAPPSAARPSRLPAFIALGAGGLLGAGALATGLVAKAKYDDAEETCGHACRDDQLSGSRAFALTSTALTGAAALGIGLGVVLLLTTPEPKTEAARLAPGWDVTVSPQAAAASARWTF